MRVDITSMFFNSSIEGQTATAAWATSIAKQSKPCLVYENQECANIINGMLFCSKSDKEKLSIKGMSSTRELIMFSIFDKVKANGKRVDGSFILLLVREHSASHDGRILLSYPMYAQYRDENIFVSNEETKNKIANSIGCSDNGCWFVYDISIENQDTLCFEAKVVDPNNSKVYKVSSKERSKEWKALIGDTDKDYGQDDKLLQQISYGAPGTGKSFSVDDVCKSFVHYRTTFHPDSDYSTFVGCYKPQNVSGERIFDKMELKNKLNIIKNSGVSYPCQKFATKYWQSLKLLLPEDIKEILTECEFTDSMSSEILKGIGIGEELMPDQYNSRIVYQFSPQVFTRAYVEAWKKQEKGEKVYLVIEEINRGNCAQIFGDLFQLLDRDENGFSKYEIVPDTDLMQYLKSQSLNAKDVLDSDGNDISLAINSGELMKLPNNLYLRATMNTSDQSLFPMDSAFKRRWEWEYMPIKRAVKAPEKNWIIKVTHDDKTYWCYWWEFLEAINHRIENATHSEDKQLGYFFAKPMSGDNFISTDTFVNKVIFYLWNDVFKDEDDLIFKYGNSIEDVQVLHSGNMYFRHFIEDKDKMIHYFINQLFSMGVSDNPVVPIDYLKNDMDEKMVEHLSKMRLACEDTPMPVK